MEQRNKQGKSNFPLDIKKEEPALFEKLKKNRIPIYSKKDQVIYVWDTDCLEQTLQQQYDLGKNDESMIPIITIDEEGMPKSRLAKGGAILDINFRKDRQKQWIDAIVNPEFDGFKVSQQAKNIDVTGMTQYVPALSEKKVILKDIKISDGLAEVLFKNDINMIYVFDAEKGKFIPVFRGGQNDAFANEDVEFGSVSMPVLMTKEQIEEFKPDLSSNLKKDKYIGWFYKGVPKRLKQIANKEYWRYPGLSMLTLSKINQQKIKNAQPGTVGLTNLDGPDLNGHVAIKYLNTTADLYVEKADGSFEIKQGNGWDSVLECLKIADTAIANILNAIEKKQGVVIIVGDHGSVDDMTQPNHSFNSVPIFIIDFKNKGLKIIKSVKGVNNTQADVAVTILNFLGIEKPKDMTGKSLLPKNYAGSKDRVIWQIILDGFGHTDFDDNQNAFAVAMKKGMMPTIKDLYDRDNYPILKASGWYAGLRGGRQDDFVKQDILNKKEVIDKVKDMKPAQIKIINYDYKNIPEAVHTYDYEKGIYELEHNPFLNDKDFIVKEIEEKIEINCLDFAQMGSTEYNTWTLGAGRIVKQSIVLGDKKFINNTINNDKVFNNYVELAKKQGYAHFVGILQEAGVHSSARQLYYFISYLKKKGVNKFVFDLASDGRDEGKKDFIKRLRQLRDALKYFKVSDYVINIRGREICFDRAKNWDLTEGWINELLYGSRIKKYYKISKNISHFI